MAYSTAPPTGNQGGDGASYGMNYLAPNSVRELWQRGLLLAEQSEDFFQKLESASNRAVIRVKTDTSKGKGQKITFSTMSGFYDEPHMGDAMFEETADFEQILMADFNLQVDYFRHATRTNERLEEVMGMRGEIESGLNVELGKWLGRLKTEQLLGLFQLELNAANVLYAGAKTLDTLKSADTLEWDEIVRMGEFIKPMGGRPANVAGAGQKAPVWANVVVPTSPALFSLKMDSDYKTLLRDGDSRGSTNHLFGGGYPNLDGHIIYPYNPIDHDGVGAVSSFLNPKAYLGTAIAIDSHANATLDITGGGSAANGALTAKHYFKYFPGHDYQFPSGAHSPSAGPHYLLIYNTSGADAGKVGMYEYTTGNDGNKIRITERLVPDNAGTYAKTTVGNVAWNGGVWNGNHVESHPSNSLIIPCNSYGVPIGDTLMLCRMAAMRGYGKYRGHRSQEHHEGGFITDRFITSVFGQCITEDRLGRHIGVVRLRHAIAYPGINLPVVS